MYKLLLKPKQQPVPIFNCQIHFKELSIQKEPLSHLDTYIPLHFQSTDLSRFIDFG